MTRLIRRMEFGKPSKNPKEVLHQALMDCQWNFAKHFPGDGE